MRTRTLLAAIAVALLTACTQSPTAPGGAQAPVVEKAFGSSTVGAGL